MQLLEEDAYHSDGSAVEDPGLVGEAIADEFAHRELLAAEVVGSLMLWVQRGETPDAISIER